MELNNLTKTFFSVKTRLSILMFLQFFIWGSWFVTGGTYLMNTLGFTGSQVGWVYGTTAIAATVSPFLTGRLADQWFSIEKILCFLHFFGGLVMLLLTQMRQFDFFYVTILIYTLLYMPTFAMSSSITFQNVNDPTKEFSRIRLWGTIGWIVAGIVVGLSGLEKTVYPLVISGICSLTHSVYCLTLPHTPPQPQGSKKLFDLELLRVLKDRNIIILIAGLTILCIPSAFYYSFTNPFMNEIGIKHSASIMSIGQMTEIILMFILPYFFTNYSLRSLILFGAFCWGIRYFLFAYEEYSFFHLAVYIGILMHGLAYCFTFLISQIYVDKIVPKHLRSSAQGFITLITLGFGVLVGSIFAGEIVEHFSWPNNSHDWRSIWAFPGFIGLVAFVFFWILFQPDLGSWKKRTLK